MSGVMHDEYPPTIDCQWFRIVEIPLIGVNLAKGNARMYGI